MPDVYASDFSEIPFALANNAALRERVLALIASEPVAGKVTEGGDRLARFREILARLVRGESSLYDAIAAVERQLPPDTSPHGGSARVFASGWAERLARTQLSRFYNQAVLESVLEAGGSEVFVPHSAAEQSDSPCTRLLAGSAHPTAELHDLLTRSYGRDDWSSKQPKVPNHPHCTHVVTPVE